ncbi:hypothetical protein G6F56_003553 [Rhizopus delemar]|nr:hypothetical protein G6F56_003553 [Rhizopus delemar]
MLKIASLNCRGLYKQQQAMKTSQFIRYLRLSGYDILVLQETHASSYAIQEQLNLQMQTQSSVWTHHCGIVSLNPKYLIHTRYIGTDNRCILSDISLHTNDSSQSLPISNIALTILNLYAPATYSSRKLFFESLTQLPPFSDTLSAPNSNILIMGDFNYRLYKPTGINATWTDMLHVFYHDCFAADKQITFKRGHSSSIIDHIFCSTQLFPRVKSFQQEFINSVWTDHSLLSVDIHLIQNDKGKGAWKANPHLSRLQPYRDQLVEHLTSFFTSHSQRPTNAQLSNQLLWDSLKEEVRIFTKTFQLERKSWRMKQIKKLNKKRNRILRTYTNQGILSELLPIVESQIGSLEEEAAEIESLKAGKLWRESGEKCAGLLKRTATTRSTQRYIADLFDKATGQLSISPIEKMDVVHTFYQRLYTPEAIDEDAIDFLLGADTHRDQHRILTVTDQELLIAPFTFDDIIEASKRTPNKSSPGADGIPYEILHILISQSTFRPLILKVYNGALLLSSFPPSWYQSIMALLPKKGDLSDITNYRPISLVNTDSKIFTRLMNNRIMGCSEKIINEFQSGFMPGRFIAENGLLSQMIIEDAQANKTSEHNLGLLLDQEKAYDRVNLDYLRRVLIHYGFPTIIVDSIYNLFHNNRITLNINGFLSDTPVLKKRGLKQGDPISCILYNFALEPLLRTILDDPAFHGYSFTHFSIAQSHLDKYSKASNAKINYHKVKAISISGNNLNDHWLSLLASNHIPAIHSRDDSQPIIYLGFPMILSRQQRVNFFSEFIQKLHATLSIHSSRSISLLGKATIANSLVLSKCWYVLRVTPVSTAELKQIQSVISNFINIKIFPKLSWQTISASKKLGGLGVLDPSIQQQALIFRWLDPILFNRDCTCSIHQYIAAHLQNKLRSHNLNVPLLFPTSRTSTNFSTLSTADMLIRSMDAIPRRFSLSEPNPIECLLLPLPAVLYNPTSSSFKLPQKLKTVKVEELHQYHPEGHYLSQKSIAEVTPSLRIVTRKLHKAIERQLIRIEDFFYECFFQTTLTLSSPVHLAHIRSNQLNFRSFKSQLDLGVPIDTEDLCTTTKQFRMAVQSNFAPSRIKSTLWQRFWKLALTFVQRNIIYRIIYNKTPHKQLLHRIHPSQHPDSFCVICGTHTDSTDHFFFSCPQSITFWNALIQEFLWPTAITAIISATHTAAQSLL